MSSSSCISEEAHPQLVAFDLDYTLWDLWIDTHVTGPLRRNGNTVNEVLDKHGETIAFYDDVPRILHGIRGRSRTIDDDDDDEDRKVIVAACSRTHAPDLADQCLRLLLVPPKHEDLTSEPKAAIHFFDELEIYPVSSSTNRIPYSEMLFFDDEARNAEVEKLGVTFHHVPQGITFEIFERGLKEWRRRRSKD
ncbi:hypothetical protein M413DRAFT_443026 [Hebeloma cylindrosporum]|uniref:Magnesium-dependent phosphatase-1 n=1 Tax=Hebeloma cylindrosporum TaxID=76867 RepID=A0A0C2Y269_HEBCY|nr:hypothetical protein M413DRAFT_443026 [Hebeloma cylindrosporum h7]